MTTHALAFWHPTRDVVFTDNFFQWDVVTRGSSADQQFRVGNLSPQYQAKDIVISVGEFGDYPPARSVAAQHYLSLNGRRFTATVTLAALMPNAVSPMITLRRVTALDADYGTGTFQVVATPGDWL